MSRGCILGCSPKRKKQRKVSSGWPRIKPEVVVDLDTGAIAQADVHPGDQADHKEMATRVLKAQQTINEARGQKADTLTVTSVTSDKGYYLVSELEALQHEGIRTIISDPIENRRVDKLEAPGQRVVRTARRSVKSKSGKDLLRRRGMHIERSFAHILDAGGMRRTTLRGWENLNKRFKLAAAFYNLSQLMRKIFGFGTPKQLAAAMARGGRALFLVFTFILTVRRTVMDTITPITAFTWQPLRQFFCNEPGFASQKNAITSTGCQQPVEELSFSLIRPFWDASSKMVSADMPSLDAYS